MTFWTVEVVNIFNMTAVQSKAHTPTRRIEMGGGEAGCVAQAIDRLCRLSLYPARDAMLPVHTQESASTQPDTSVPCAATLVVNNCAKLKSAETRIMFVEGTSIEGREGGKRAGNQKIPHRAYLLVRR